MYPVKRKVINKDNRSYIVDVWLESGKYNANGQELYVDDFRSHFVKGCNTETNAEHEIVELLSTIYK